jgi:hypothetical protein
LQSNWGSISNRKRLFDETEISNDEVIAPGTVIISAGGNCTDIKVVEPVLQRDGGYINLSQDEYKLEVLRLHKH